MLAEDFDTILHNLGMAWLEHPLFHHAPVAIRFEIGGDEPVYLECTYSDENTEKLTPTPAYVQGALERAIMIYRNLPAPPGILRIDGYPEEKPVESLLTAIQQRAALPAPHEQVTATMMDEDGDTYAQVQFYWDLSKISFQPERLLQEIILGDIGGWNGFVSSVYLTGPGPFLYHLYDDRGLDILGGSRELLLPLYHQFNDWIWNTIWRRLTDCSLRQKNDRTDKKGGIIMGLDIYAGTLTRYYSHNWKTVVQQWAEENGYAFNRITPDGEPADNEEELSAAEVQAAVENWRDQILNAISQPGQPPYAPWPENNESPYYTDKPDWDAFGAMLLAAACHTYEEPVPPTVEKDWNFGEHPLVARLAADQERVWSLFRGATWWLPLPDAFFFQAPLPTDDTAAIGTVGGLRKELEKLNQLAWQADEDTILDWADTEGYPADGTVGPDGQYSKADIPEHTQYDTQSLAKFAFSMFWRAMRFAEEQQVPILLDF